MWHELVRPRGNRLWDWIIRGTGLTGLLGIALVLAIPGTGPLVGFALVTAWLTGPLSPFFPFGYEPIVMLMARLHGVLLVTSVSVATMLAVEWIALHLYGEVLSLGALRRFRRHRWTRATRRLFGRAPFLAIWLVSWSPIPFWTVRVLGSLARYPMHRYLAAVFLGRFPKILLFAWLGIAWQVSGWLLGAAVAASLAVGLMAWLRRRGRPGSADGRKRRSSGRRRQPQALGQTAASRAERGSP